MKLSQHSKLRLKERTNFNHNERKQIFRNALKNGKCPQQIKNVRIRQYLLSKQRYNSRIKLYDNYVFIYSKNGKQLYTMYKLPENLVVEK